MDINIFVTNELWHTFAAAGPALIGDEAEAIDVLNIGKTAACNLAALGRFRARSRVAGVRRRGIVNLEDVASLALKLRRNNL